MTTIPVIIIAFNQFSYIRNMVNQCLPITEKIFIIDNVSTYKPLIDYYDNEVPRLKNVEIIKNPINEGHLVWLKYLHLFPEEYVVTDPDLLFNPEMPNNVVNILSNLRQKFKVKTIGFALDISDHHNFTNAKFRGISIYDWESRFWQNKIQSTPEELYNAAIDTTFALRTKSDDTMMSSIRIAGKFTCKHIPWYRYDVNPLPIPEEERIFYMKTSKYNNWKIQGKEELELAEN